MDSRVENGSYRKLNPGPIALQGCVGKLPMMTVWRLQMTTSSDSANSCSLFCLPDSLWAIDHAKINGRGAKMTRGRRTLGRRMVHAER
jgi:hypothetical protein